ncbi:MAG: septum formation initiator family protein [Candidatus Nomurabacteria bacterium]|nr:MAG: septum formation initiator family protein [Candidatus Nomurabacteria bacterium]
MQNRQIKRFIYTVRHQYMTMNNMVLAVAVVIAVGWAWSSVEAVQRNYQLQKEVNDKRRQAKLIELQTENLQFEQNYYKSNEYLTLEAKRRLGLVEPGEKVLILPANSASVVAEDQAEKNADTLLPDDVPPPPPLTQWLDFLFGAKPNAR